MQRQVFVFDPPERFVAGTVGQPGERTFFLQARDAMQTVSVSLEKVQVSVLADRLEELLGEVQRRRGEEEALPVDPAEPDTAPLDTPVEEQFRVGAMGLAWDAEADRIVVEAQAATEEPVDESTILEDVEEGPDALRVRITPVAAQSFVARARRVIAAGRPQCPLCALPLDAQGHVCPRQNGYRRQT
ncbi:MAG TPA: DUF3090 domain-containing protein [Mycobacteriales bacterium]|jgi:uncharacterized repeat protein (TIGR03847 family)|nr:DUF3090 domain-containing protein [Mycobacteriales bacterium]